jgi:hypothetical protein
VCSLTGKEFIHSIEEEIPKEFITLREDARLSQIIHINIITDTKEIKDPKDDTIFHVVKASG